MVKMVENMVMVDNVNMLSIDMVNFLVKVIILLNYKLCWAVANHEHSDVLWMHDSKVIVCDKGSSIYYVIKV